MLPKVLALVTLGILHLPWSSTQGCLSKQQVANTIRQMQKLLSSHEAAQLQNMRNLKKQLTILQGNIQKQVAKRNESCTLLPAPLNGRRLGKKTFVGHDAHFLCDSGFLLVGSETRTCLDNGTWSGQQPLCKNWVTLSNSSFSRQPRCADNALGSRQCSCDTGFQMQAGGICQDVDECQLFQSRRPTRICLHECVNLPGSYRCTCPAGYRLQADKSTCVDVDECTENQHNCSRGQMCINVYGGFQCVRPECPKPQLNTSYVKTSVAQCERSPCPMDSKACQRAANSISFHYLPLQSNRTVPRVLFKMSTSRFVGDSLRFAILGGNSQGMLAVQRADRQTGELVLTRPAVGPTMLEAELEMSEFARKISLGKHIFKVTVFVSQYEF
ncbi:fibulin-7-like isoform X2 [Heteronotia binoei]|uniref:fibulin-7-like isoform X2 n=1 Tax=Heteronotia binoei TaxID=13085 RepID=UPI00292FCA68|nr:fibulin-7-like isoform X2 [Heteronotia binoei]